MEDEVSHPMDSPAPSTTGTIADEMPSATKRALSCAGVPPAWPNERSSSAAELNQPLS